MSAGEAFARAGVYYHVAQIVITRDPTEKARLQIRQQAASRKGLPYLNPCGEQFDVPFEDIVFPANLRVPVTGELSPCVVLNAGGDSTKEEFFTLENEFLKRGVATCTYDGPGQSLTWHKQKLRHDFEKPVGALLDVLERHPRLDPQRFGIWGRSMGGYAAPRVAARDRRIKACVSAGGFFSLLDTWDRGHQELREILVFALGAQSMEDAREKTKPFTLEGVLDGQLCPTLVVHSGADTTVNAAEGKRIATAAGATAQLVIFPEGTHVCDNIPYKVRPLMADWMAEHLAKSPG